jgi:hypothetical protein
MRRNSVISIVTNQGLEERKIKPLQGQEIFSFPKRPCLLFNGHLDSPPLSKLWRVRLINPLHLVSRL